MDNQWCNQIGNVNLTFELRISIDAENRFYRTFLRPLDLNFSGPNDQEPIYIGAENEGAGDSSLLDNNSATVGLINGNYSHGQSSTAADDSHLTTAMLPMIPNASAQEFMSPVVSRGPALHQESFAAAVPNASSQEFMSPVVSRGPALNQEYFAAPVAIPNASYQAFMSPFVSRGPALQQHYFAAAVPNASSQECMIPRGPALHQEYFASAAAPPPPIPDLNVEFRPEDNTAADAPPPPPIPDLNAEFRLEDNPPADAILPNGNVNVPAEGNADVVDEDEDILTRSRRRRATEVIYNDPARKCYFCQSNDTPMWRKGPRGRNTLCNACGIHYRKKGEKKRKARSGAAAGTGTAKK